MLWPTSKDISEQISSDYAVIADRNASGLTRSLQDLPIPWENATLGFSGSDLSLPKKAFGAGLWTGRTALLGMDASKFPSPEFLSPPSGSTWLESEWVDYYQFGRWVMLLWALTRSEESIGSWSQQQRILEELRANLAKRPSNELAAGQALAALERVQPLLVEVQRQADPSARTHLNRRLEMIMQQLAPIKGQAE
jgi:hypothetical protein